MALVLIDAESFSWLENIVLCHPDIDIGDTTASIARSFPSETPYGLPRRPKCKWGEVGCTRKNPVHFDNYSHPGDDDWGR